jgi:hypothetical protein
MLVRYLVQIQLNHAQVVMMTELEVAEEREVTQRLFQPRIRQACERLGLDCRAFRSHDFSWYSEIL